jgi:hypothetical protein
MAELLRAVGRRRMIDNLSELARREWRAAKAALGD